MLARRPWDPRESDCTCPVPGEDEEYRHRAELETVRSERDWWEGEANRNVAQFQVVIREVAERLLSLREAVRDPKTTKGFIREALNTHAYRLRDLADYP